MKSFSKNLQYSSISYLLDNSWIERQRYSGKILSSIMSKLISIVKNKENLSLLDMDKFCEEEILKNNCSPTFKGYKGFPNSLITSVNKQLVHAIPSNYKLKEGDLISFDFGVTFEGAITDSATTLVFGNPLNSNHQKMINAGENCLYNAIKSINLNSKIGVIGNCINKTAKHAGFQVIQQFGGHGLTWNSPHSAPFVPNKSEVNEGIRFQPGMSIAIEPLLVPNNCSTQTKKDADGWTIYTEDVSTHHEHTIFIHPDRVEIMTHREDEKINREIFFKDLS